MNNNHQLTFVMKFVGYVFYFLIYGLWKLAAQLARGAVSKGELLSMLIRAPRESGCRPVKFCGPGFQPKQSSHYRKHHRGGRKHKRHHGGNHHDHA